MVRILCFLLWQISCYFFCQFSSFSFYHNIRCFFFFWQLYHFSFSQFSRFLFRRFLIFFFPFLFGDSWCFLFVGCLVFFYQSFPFTLRQLSLFSVVVAFPFSFYHGFPFSFLPIFSFSFFDSFLVFVFSNLPVFFFGSSGLVFFLGRSPSRSFRRGLFSHVIIVFSSRLLSTPRRSAPSQPPVFRILRAVLPRLDWKH